MFQLFSRAYKAASLRIVVLLLCLCGLSGLFATPGFAAASLLDDIFLALRLDAGPDEQQLSLGATAGISNSPYREYGTRWSLFPLISYEGPKLFVRGTTAGFKIVNRENFEFAAYGSYNGLEYDDSESDNERMRRLDDRHASMLGGLSARLSTPLGQFHASAGVDMVGNSGGLAGDLGWIFALDTGVVKILPEAGIYWQSKEYTDYYFGVSSRESRKSGLERYEAGGAVSPYLGLSLNVSLTRHWGLFCKGELLFYDREIRKSPMVDKAVYQGLNMGVLYTF